MGDGERQTPIPKFGESKRDTPTLRFEGISTEFHLDSARASPIFRLHSRSESRRSIHRTNSDEGKLSMLHPCNQFALDEMAIYQSISKDDTVSFSPIPRKTPALHVTGSKMELPPPRSESGAIKEIGFKVSAESLKSNSEGRQNKFDSPVLKKQSGSSHVMPFVNDDIYFPPGIENGICVRKVASQNGSVSRSPTLSSSLPSNGKLSASSSSSSSSSNFRKSTEKEDETEDTSKPEKNSYTSVTRSFVQNDLQLALSGTKLGQVRSGAITSDQSSSGIGKADPVDLNLKSGRSSSENGKEGPIISEGPRLVSYDDVITNKRMSISSLFNGSGNGSGEADVAAEAIPATEVHDKLPTLSYGRGTIPKHGTEEEACKNSTRKEGIFPAVALPLRISKEKLEPRSSKKSVTRVREIPSSQPIQFSRIIPKEKPVGRKELAVTGCKYKPIPLFSIERSRGKLSRDEGASLQDRGHGMDDRSARISPRRNQSDPSYALKMDFKGEGLSITGSGCGLNITEPSIGESSCWASRNQDGDTEMVENLRQVSEESDRDVLKLTRELNEANTILTSIHSNIQSLTAERQHSQTALEGVKLDYRALLDEKAACQKQINIFKRYLSAGKINDRRIAREIDQLCVCYDRLDQREKYMRRQISILEAELALVVSRLKVPLPSKTPSIEEKLPSLNLNKIRSRQNKLPPVTTLPKVSLTNKICPKVPKEILNITRRSEEGLLKLPNKSKSRKSRERGCREFPQIDIRAQQASKQVNEIEKECKLLYEKGNEILKQEATSRRKQRTEEMKAIAEKFAAQSIRRGTSYSEGGTHRLPDICPYAQQQRQQQPQRRRCRSDVIWNDLSVVDPPRQKPEVQRHRKRAVLPELGHCKVNLSNRCRNI